MAQLPTGSVYTIASSFGSAKTTTIVTNASEAVVTSAAHGFSNGDYVEVTSGWGRLNLRTARIKSVTTDTFVLEGIDTTSTTFYPAGTGIGSVRKVTAWTQITQVLTPSSSGGDPKQVTYSYIESDVSYTINDGFNPVSYSLDLDADSIGTAGYTALKSLTDAQTTTSLKLTLRAGSIILIPCTVALNETVQLSAGQINKVVCAFSGVNRQTRYSS